MISDAPKFRFDSPSATLLDDLVKGYQRITGVQIRGQRQRNLLAACHRVHGSDVLPHIDDLFTTQGTVRNLLGMIRCASPRGPDDRQQVADHGVRRGADASTIDRAFGVGVKRSPDHDGPPCPIERCLPNLIFCQDHFPAFDPTSRRRHDRHPSNPDAACYFGDQGSRTSTTTVTRAK